ncbi:hypothetical protein [Mycolicibacterium aichiense]|uniref:hypothetical protein n=1 Tax=Mycolicibacterium aichiense TaxID=1799 RepID=UPI000DFCD2FF|nr:hypothetical protein [Mycolicibacterium aichiense]MCV7017178.1 hypothetical protein [Mycolicibacterium aichiense]STZ25948.1 Conserved membrane protein of uncharacterised function, alanine and proline rich protein [Mycolicibacterium aichiense]
MPTIIAIVIAVIAVAVAIGAWFRPAPKPETPAAKTYSEQEVADAKKAVCTAFNHIYHTLDVSNRKIPNNTGDAFAIIVNNRLAVHISADYLLRQLAENPAAPSNISSSVQKLATTYEETVLEQIGDSDKDRLDTYFKTADELQTSLQQDCV